MKLVVVNKEFRDRYTNKLHKVGVTLQLTKERIDEIKEVDSSLIDVVGDVSETNKAAAQVTDEVDEIKEVDSSLIDVVGDVSETNKAAAQVTDEVDEIKPTLDEEPIEIPDEEKSKKTKK